MESVTEQAKEAFQVENISLVQSNGNHFKNSDTTKRFQFFNSPARKVYAILDIPGPEAGNTEVIKQMGRKN